MTQHYVYVLCDSRGRLYKGMTKNLERRLAQHRSGQTKTTKSMSDLRVVYEEIQPDLRSARKREVYLKTAAGRRFLKKILAK